MQVVSDGEQERQGLAVPGASLEDGVLARQKGREAPSLNVRRNRSPIW